jgi:hypothetical protein
MTWNDGANVCGSAATSAAAAPMEKKEIKKSEKAKAKPAKTGHAAAHKKSGHAHAATPPKKEAHPILKWLRGNGKKA